MRPSDLGSQSALVSGYRRQPGETALYVEFLADDEAEVNAAYAAAFEAGGKSEGEPAMGAYFGPSYYAANISDFDGNHLVNSAQELQPAKPSASCVDGSKASRWTAANPGEVWESGSLCPGVAQYRLERSRARRGKSAAPSLEMWTPAKDRVERQANRSCRRRSPCFAQRRSAQAGCLSLV